MFKRFTLETVKNTFYDITDSVEGVVAQSGVSDGLATIYCPHTTAGITINEHYDPTVVHDMVLALALAFPDRPEFTHGEGNSAAHMKAGVMGASQTVPIQNGRLLLGRWQGVFFCEFDGPRHRTFYVDIR